MIDRTKMDCRTGIGRLRLWLGIVTVVACGRATSACAEVHVKGDFTALQVSASGDPLSAVLSAFGASLPVRYRSSVPLDAEISGAYAGSLSQVVARLLDGYNYMIRRDQGLTEIIVFSRRGQEAVAPTPAMPKGALSRWR